MYAHTKRERACGREHERRRERERGRWEKSEGREREQESWRNGGKEREIE